LERRIAQALAEQKVFADIVESSTAAITALDQDWRILAINHTNIDAFSRIFGKRPTVGDHFLGLFDGAPELAEQQRAIWSRALDGETFVVTQQFGNPRLEQRSYEVRFSPLLNSQGDRIGASSTSYDVTDRIVAETQLKIAQEHLRHSQKLESMGQLTGGVAHDFNNLLTPIVGVLDILQRTGFGQAREQRLIANAAQSADRAKTLVQRLLAFARRQPLQPLAVDIGKLVTGMGDLLSSTTGPQIRVVVETAPELPAALADPNQLEMAILNLAVNARDAMPDGGVLRLSATTERLGAGHRSGLAPGEYVCISVSDNGIGMDQQTVARAIEPFFSTKGVGKGTGLGLSMVHGLALQLGGALNIQSRAGFGTNVELWLPECLDPPNSDAQATVAPPRDVAGTALLVDDEDLVRIIAAEILEELGYEVMHASSAEEALALIEAGAAFDLLVTDHLMPGMSGTDLARKVVTERPEKRVVILSGYAESEGIAPDLPRLTKPFRKQEFAELLASLKI
jgi:signal transduction histidine kinase/CheY-like chemotaxis protein